VAEDDRTDRAGEERDGVDFSLQLVSTARVEGIVSLPEGGVPSGTEVHIITVGESATPGLPFEGYRPGHPAADGTFSFTTNATGGTVAAPTVRTFTYTVSDGNGGSTTGTVTVNGSGKLFHFKPLGDVRPVVDAGGLFNYARKTGMITA